MALQIEFTKQALKEFRRAPRDVKEAAELWLVTIKTIGVENTRKAGGKGLHDEPLKGRREGQRSIRLNRSWRLIYELNKGELQILRIISITKHDYR